MEFPVRETRAVRRVNDSAQEEGNAVDTAQDPLVSWLFSLQGPALKWDMDTARSFCVWLGRPERGFPALHIAGTNGKGSVAALAESIARVSGLSTGLYTSPHLVRPEERIRLGAADISRDAFRSLIERLRRAAAAAVAAGAVPRHPSFFEMMTAAAFVAFAERRVELGVVETGLGGRLDATNVLDPRVSVITTIALDHVKTLGGTLEAIAREKAGIIKPEAPVLVGWVPPEAREVFEATAREREAPLHLAERELDVAARDDGSFDVTTPLRAYRSLRCALAGPHQRRNAALAIRAAELLRERGTAIDLDAVADGLVATHWPGRLERLDGALLAADLPPVRSCLLDGAHNMEGIGVLAAALADADRRAPVRRAMVFGLTEGRDAHKMIGPLAPHVARVVVARPGIVKAIDPAEVHAALVEAAPQLAPELVPDPAEALRRAAELAGPDGELLVAGSLYLVGDARRVLLDLDGTGHPRRETQIAPALV